jgi:methyltransferase
MELSVPLYLVLLGAVGASRLIELRVSRRNQRRLAARGAHKASAAGLRWMVVVHGGMLAGAAAEVVLLRRPLVPALALATGGIFVFACAIRWWVIRTLGEFWNVEVMASAGLGVVTSGPYCWIRHPNYLAVCLELAALPLIHSAWLTATVGSLAHGVVLRKRIAIEETALLADSTYRSTMGNKPRFVPRLWGRGGGAAA